MVMGKGWPPASYTGTSELGTCSYWSINETETNCQSRREHNSDTKLANPCFPLPCSPLSYVYTYKLCSESITQFVSCGLRSELVCDAWGSSYQASHQCVVSTSHPSNIITANIMIACISLWLDGWRTCTCVHLNTKLCSHGSAVCSHIMRYMHTQHNHVHVCKLYTLSSHTINAFVISSSSSLGRMRRVPRGNSTGWDRWSREHGGGMTTRSWW